MYIENWNFFFCCTCARAPAGDEWSVAGTFPGEGVVFAPAAVLSWIRSAEIVNAIFQAVKAAGERMPTRIS